jgi:hypothetical protein
MPGFAGLLPYGSSAAQQLKEEEYDGHDQHKVNERGGHVKSEKPEQPENNQNQSDESEHVVIS